MVDRVEEREGSCNPPLLLGVSWVKRLGVGRVRISLERQISATTGNKCFCPVLDNI